MLRFTIESLVPYSFKLVSENFSESLFRALAPAFPPSELITFDGDRVGGLVKIKLGAGALSKIWVSEIVSREVTESKVEFIDVGLELPPPLSEWKHKHVIKKINAESTLIVDDIQFSTGWSPFDYAIYPIMKAMFAARTPAYKKYYKDLASK